MAQACLGARPTVIATLSSLQVLFYEARRVASSDVASLATELAGLAAAGTQEQGDDARAAESQGPRAKYDAMIARGELRQDTRQALTVDQLERVYQDLITSRQSRTGSGLTLVDASSSTKPRRRRTGWWVSIVDSLGDHPTPPSAPSSPRGLYMYGGPGCGMYPSPLPPMTVHSRTRALAGPNALTRSPMHASVRPFDRIGKTMLMDMFASSLPRDMAKGMARVHFHDFMLDVHESLQEHRATPDPLQKVAKDIAAKSSLICLDELFVNDIADATILHRLFDNLWGRDVTLITTSNRHPDHLYENGLQRQLFIPFIETIKTRCVRVVASPSVPLSSQRPLALPPSHAHAVLFA